MCWTACGNHQGGIQLGHWIIQDHWGTYSAIEHTGNYVFPGVKGHVLECVGLPLGHPQAPVGSIVGDRMCSGVTQGARQPLMGPVEVQSQGRRKQKHRGSVAALGPGACASPHVPAGQGFLQPNPSVPAAVKCPEDSQLSLLGEGRRLNFSCLPKCYCLYRLWKSVLWPALFVQ